MKVVVIPLAYFCKTLRNHTSGHMVLCKFSISDLRVNDWIYPVFSCVNEIGEHKM